PVARREDAAQRPACRAAGRHVAHPARAIRGNVAAERRVRRLVLLQLLLRTEGQAVEVVEAAEAGRLDAGRVEPAPPERRGGVDVAELRVVARVRELVVRQ